MHQPHTISSCNFFPICPTDALIQYFTESTSLLHLHNIYHAIDEGSSTILISPDLRAAFDTVDHPILLNRLQTSFGRPLLRFILIFLGGVSSSALAVPGLPSLDALLVFHRGPSWVRYFFPLHHNHSLHCQLF